MTKQDDTAADARPRRMTRPPVSATRSRSGRDDQATEIEGWTDEAEAHATGLLRFLDEKGQVDRERVPELAPADWIRMYRGMLQSRLLDDRLMPMQRQGRIGFYIECRGQEAGMIAGAHAITPDDWFVQGLRETAAGLYRGVPLQTHLAQMFGNTNDPAHGHQLPCHSGTRASRHLTMSSCVSSQLPQATGIAYAAKLSEKNQSKKTVVLGYLGDGGTSAEDFHVALNFAAVWQAPVVFVCQNNQWAISTPLNKQTASRTIAIKGLAYGIPSYRVDGNDIIAMYVTIKAAVDRARAGGGPTFIEALTYRLGPHSSSDDPSRYRDQEEAAAWLKKEPLARFKIFLEQRQILGAAEEAALRAELDREIRETIAVQEAAAKPAVRTLIEDVTHRPNWLLEEQLAELERVRGARGNGSAGG